MKSTNLILIYLLAVIFFLSCTKEDDKKIVNPETSLNFSIERQNSDNNFTSKVLSGWVKEKGSNISISDKGARLSKEIIFNLILENNDTIRAALFISNFESDTNLITHKTQPNTWGSEWDYKSTKDEITNFYNSQANLIFILDYSHQINFYDNGGAYEIKNAYSVISEGQEKTYLEIEFSGTAYGVFDPDGIWMEYYQITEGIFKGVIE